MFKSILVAVDGSTHSKAAVEYGGRLAAKFGGRIELLHVIEQRLLVGDFITHFTEVFRRKIDRSFAEWVERYALGTLMLNNCVGFHFSSHPQYIVVFQPSGLVPWFMGSGTRSCNLIL
jgi:Universal stress protein family